MKTLLNQYGGKFCINEKFYGDRVDVTFEISLYEYGVVRNPKTNKTIIGVNTDNTGMYTNFDFTYVTLEDVKEHLEEIEESYFSYIGVDNKEKHISNLDNNNLAHEIHSINQYDSWFNLSS